MNFMSRIRIIVPQKKHFSTSVSLRVYDMNYGNHLGNDSVLSIAHEVRIRFLNSLGLSEHNFYGYGLLMADSAVVYKKQGIYGDKLEIRLSVIDLSKYGFGLVYQMINTKNNHELCRVKTGLVCYNYYDKKLVQLSNKFKVLFS